MNNMENMDNNYTFDNGIAPGFSPYANDPKLIKKAGKTKKWAKKITAVFIVICIVVLIVGIFMKNVVVAAVGGILAFAGLFVLIRLAIKDKFDQPWDGVVVKKQKKTHTSRDNDGHRTSTTTYIVKFKTDEGKRKKLISPKYYEYLEEGDRVRYHPHLYDCYEKYDKSKDEFIYCAACGGKNLIKEDHCYHCNCVLLK